MNLPAVDDLRAVVYKFRAECSIRLAHYLIWLQSLVKMPTHMNEIWSVPIQHQGKEYFALVRVKKMLSGVEYHVTVMNGDLEMRLYGHHVFVLSPNGICAKLSCEDPVLLVLQQTIILEIEKQITIEAGLVAAH